MFVKGMDRQMDNSEKGRGKEVSISMEWLSRKKEGGLDREPSPFSPLFISSALS